MKLPISWLNEYVSTAGITPEELSDKLLSIGFEVEEIDYTGENVKNVVVGKVLAIDKLEGYDKLHVCKIDVGDETLQIVTGAQNVKQNDRVPVAKVGAVLVGGKTIKAGAFRDTQSFGMLCSGNELGIDDNVIDGAEVDGILILPKNAPIGKDIMEYLNLKDCVLDISVTANRPDCQAVANMAKEIAVMLKRKYTAPSLDYSVTKSTRKVPVTIAEPALCSRYRGRIIEDVKIEKSPKWMRDRLTKCGIRAINNIVDITNYVLLEMGQPLHAFDMRYIDNGITVRKGKSGESIVALDGKKYDADGVLLIADDSKPLAIAGIMGGEYTSIFDDTVDVFLEAARFERSNIRRTSRAIGLRSDSSARFEKGVDWQTVENGANRALALMQKLKVGRILSSVSSAQESAPRKKVITTSAAQICSVLGINIKENDIIKILNAQGITTEKSDKTDSIKCTVPLEREDVDNFTDLAEDVMRFYGYDKIAETHLDSSHCTSGGLSPRDSDIARVKSLMSALGFDEAINYSFINPSDNAKLGYGDTQCIPLKNPLNVDMSVMRTQLVSSLLHNCALNQARKNGNLALYELSRVFIPESLPLEKLPQERHHIAAVKNYGDFYALKDAVMTLVNNLAIDCKIEKTACKYLHPGIGADIVSNGKVIGSFGKLHPTVAESFDLSAETYVAEIDIEDMLGAARSAVRAKPLPKFPSVDRDLAVTVDIDVTVGSLIEVIKGATGILLESVRLFDVYTGKQIPDGKKSLAFSLTLRSTDGTLTDALIQKTMGDAVAALERVGAELR